MDVSLTGITLTSADAQLFFKSLAVAVPLGLTFGFKLLSDWLRESRAEKKVNKAEAKAFDYVPEAIPEKIKELASSQESL